MNLGERIREHRERKGLSLRQLSDEISVAASTIGDWERGDSRPRPKALAKVASYFGTTQAELEYGRGNVAQPVEKFDHVEVPGQSSWSVPMRGYVGANTEFTPFEDFDEMIETRVKPVPSTFAMVVDGDSMKPPFGHGTVLLASRRESNPDKHIGDAVVCGLPDGRVIFKVLERGTRNGVFRLHSLNSNYEDLLDQRVDYVLPLDNVQF
ncbi:XRE family transcriptional regulator [Litorimonas sp. WD9-15]|uniref:XRE family transcriptional regulator n=1 Tax=Litorimonas sp. WD9-15 TaxID=3418716 RepID=UPI003D04A2D2